MHNLIFSAMINVIVRYSCYIVYTNQVCMYVCMYSEQTINHKCTEIFDRRNHLPARKMRGSRRRRSLQVLWFWEGNDVHETSTSIKSSSSYAPCSCSFRAVCQLDSSNVSNCIIEDTNRWTQMNSFRNQLNLPSIHTGDTPTIHNKKTTI